MCPLNQGFIFIELLSKSVAAIKKINNNVVL